MPKEVLILGFWERFCTILNNWQHEGCGEGLKVWMLRVFAG